MGKREDILHSTLDLIVSEGLESLTFAKIFKHAGVGSGTVYNYFSSKEELINELYKTVGLHMSEYTLDGYNREMTLYERFRFFVSQMIRFSLEYPKEIWLLENYAHSPDISAPLRNAGSLSMEEFYAVLQEGQAQGIILEMNPMMCCQMVSGLALAVIKGFLNRKYELGEQEINQTIACCWKAIKV